MTGVAVPVFSLRSEESCGVGEFLDLEPLGRWCRRVGIELIQILPVNDTGFTSSPYSALSALALHPIYLRLQDLPGAERLQDEIEAFRQEQRGAGRLRYEPVLRFKLGVLRVLYEESRARVLDDPEIAAWVERNEWVVPYAVFSALKQRFELKSWREWPEARDMTEDEIRRFWEEERDETFYYAWVQFHLERQLRRAAETLDDLGLRLKGDIPILMSEDSADVWAYRRYFNLQMRAGAPPDMFSRDGQNWGFPTYNWPELEEDGYRWWKLRLKQADKFYHAYRIDHVLGFFRIWRVPEDEQSGLLGHFHPSVPLRAEELHGAGFDAERLRWLTVPRVSAERLREALGDRAGEVRERYLRPLGDDPHHYTLRHEFESERALHDAPEPEPVRRFLIDLHQDRTLLEGGPGELYPSWFHFETKAYASLTEREKESLGRLIGEKQRQSEQIWADQGRTLLRMMKASTPMLPCAEDLGAVPDCVPHVLAELEILSLKIERWARRWQTDRGFIPPAEFPRLSVCTPSVHDTTSLRGWWEEEQDRSLYCRQLGMERCPDEMTPDFAERIVRRNLHTNSIISVFQFQDFFALAEEMRRDPPEAERINVPGTIGERNWSYRLPVTLEELERSESFNERLRRLVSERATSEALI